MDAVAIFVPSEPVGRRWKSGAAVAASLLLHLALVLMLLWAPWAVPFEPAPLEFVVEVATLPPPLPEPPRPAPQVLPPVVQGPPPPPPQLQDAQIAEKSVAPPTLTEEPVRLAPRASASPPPAEKRTVEISPSALKSLQSSLAPPAPSRQSPVTIEPALQSTQMSAVSKNPAPGAVNGGRTEETVSQSVQDFILKQILTRWVLDFSGAQFRNVELNGNLVLLPNGMLGPPFGKNDPWRPQEMIRDYDKLQSLSDGRAIQTALITFIQAARQAQPFRLPLDGKADQPRLLPFDFRLGDISRPAG